jgi:hypothetical protein
MHLILQLFAGMYFVLLFLRGDSRLGGVYLFAFKVQVVNAFGSKVLSREERAWSLEPVACSLYPVSGRVLGVSGA